MELGSICPDRFVGFEARSKSRPYERQNQCLPIRQDYEIVLATLGKVNQ